MEFKSSFFSKLVGMSQPSVYQFKITLLGIEPSIWRRIQVPSDYGFFAFHSAIQDAMRWKCTGPYLFQQFSGKPELTSIRLPYKETSPSYEHDSVISYCFKSEGDTSLYLYDGKWQCRIVLEQIFDRPLQGVTTYPECVDGERGCPPEGIACVRDYEYHRLVAVDRYHPMHNNVVTFLHSMGYSDRFSPKSVVFKDPKERFEAFYGAFMI